MSHNSKNTRRMKAIYKDKKSGTISENHFHDGELVGASFNNILRRFSKKGFVQKLHWMGGEKGCKTEASCSSMKKGIQNKQTKMPANEPNHLRVKKCFAPSPPLDHNRDANNSCVRVKVYSKARKKAPVPLMPNKLPNYNYPTKEYSNCNLLRQTTSLLNDNEPLSSSAASTSCPVSTSPDEEMSPKPWYKRKSSKQEVEKNIFSKGKRLIPNSLMSKLQKFTRKHIISPPGTDLLSDCSNESYWEFLPQPHNFNQSKMDYPYHQIEDTNELSNISQEVITPSSQDANDVTAKLGEKDFSTVTYDNLALYYKPENLLGQELPGIARTEDQPQRYIKNEWRLSNPKNSEIIEKISNLENSQLQSLTKEISDTKFSTDSQLNCLTRKVLSVKKEPSLESDNNSLNRKRETFGFAPEVSVISETSESIASCSDNEGNLYEVIATMSLAIDNDNASLKNVHINESAVINTCDLQESINSLTANFKTNDETMKRINDAKCNGNKIQGDGFLFRDRNNFLAWENDVQEMKRRTKENLVQNSNNYDLFNLSSYCDEGKSKISQDFNNHIKKDDESQQHVDIDYIQRAKVNRAYHAKSLWKNLESDDDTESCMNGCNKFKGSANVRSNGVVKNFVTIFNEIDQSNLAEKSGHTFVSEAMRKNGLKKSVSQTTESHLVKSDFVSVINKFDEMAAFAEIEKINKTCTKATKSSKVGVSSTESIINCPLGLGAQINQPTNKVNFIYQANDNNCQCEKNSPQTFQLVESKPLELTPENECFLANMTHNKRLSPFEDIASDLKLYDHMLKPEINNCATSESYSQISEKEHKTGNQRSREANVKDMSGHEAPSPDKESSKCPFSFTASQESFFSCVDSPASKETFTIDHSVFNSSVQSILNSTPPCHKFKVKMSVEDKNSHFGSTIINVHSHMTVGVLKEKVFQDFGFPCEIQRWILGRVLADDDHKSLEFYNVTSAGCTIFLYLVELEAKNFTSTWENPVIGFTNKVKIERPAKAQTKCHHETKRKKLLNQSTKLIPQLQIPEPHSVTVSDITPTVNAEDSEDDSVVKELKQKENTQVDANWTCPSCTLVNSVDRPGCEACTMERPRDVDFKSKLSWEQEMVILESSGCVINTEPFKCSICLSWFKCGEGVVLRNCLHHFCRDCLSSSIKYSESADVKCPFGDKDFQCTFPLQEREIKDLLNEYEYQKYLDKCLKQAAWTMKNIFHCKTVNCKGICEYDDGVKTFSCNICNQINCLICQAQHHKETCQQYQNDLSNKEDEATLQTRKLFEDIIHRGDGMFCPQCTVMLIRKWGCDWMRCPMCKTEICWVTQGRRWGPKGEGDTSGGCRCGVNGRKCHPKCNYCH